MRRGLDDGRSSALWSRGSKGESRSSALWGKRGGRTAVAATVLALTLALPTAGLAGGNGPSLAAVVDAGLLAQVQANPQQSVQVIVQGAPGASADTLAREIGKKHGTVTNVFANLGSAAATLKSSDVVKLAADDAVAGITADNQLHVQGYQNDEAWRQADGFTPLYSQPAVTCASKQKNCLSVQAFQAAQAPAIAIVDSGIDPTKVNDFGGRIEASVDFVSSEPGVTGDPLGHGTMVAGVAAGSAQNHLGASPTSPLVNVRVADSQGEAQTSDIIAGLNWILQHKDELGIRVVNISLGSTISSSIAFDPLDQAVEQLWLNGLVVVTAVGNAGLPNSPVSIGAPANDPFVITVGALDLHQNAKTDDDYRAPWSSYGTTDDGFAKPELSAAGRYMIAPVPDGSLLTQQHPDRCSGKAKQVDPGYMWMSGTSFAAPVVSGAAAQVLAVHPDWTPDQVKGALMDTATPLKGGGAAGTGVGEVNAAAAIADASPDNPNASLQPFAAVDPATGLTEFAPNAWHTAAATSNWVRSAGTASNWVKSNWVKSNWVSSNWVRSNWVSTTWVEATGAD